MSDATEAGVARVMTPWELLLYRIGNALVRLRRKLPYVVWYDQELDVGVRFVGNRLTSAPFDGASPGETFPQLWSGAIHSAEKSLHNAGIYFDTGMGCAGRDWEWDFSLRGPISVRFRSRATRPERRGWDEALLHLAEVKTDA
jgi:hypothetical protein